MSNKCLVVIPFRTGNVFVYRFSWCQFKLFPSILRTLIASRPGLSWSTDITEDIASMVTNFTTELVNSGLTETVLGQLTTLDWTAELAGLQRAAALGIFRTRNRDGF